jgi:hypothetical protein
VARDRTRIPCAVASADRGEPLVGTASRVRRWLVVEQPGPWGRDAVVESGLDPLVARTLVAQGRRHSARILLVRRPGWRSDGTRKVFLVRSDATVRWLREVEIADERDLLTLDLDVLAHDRPPAFGVPGPPSLHLVCAHGKHDQCCANLGRPVIRALAAAGAPDVWEASHVGGDRFAANLVCLPSGVYYGRVEPEVALHLLAETAAGRIDLDHYRGRSCYPPLVQAADAFVRRELGERRLDAVVLRRIVRHDPDDATVVFAVDGLDVDVAVRLRRSRTAEVHYLTCADGGSSQPWAYVLITVTQSRVVVGP